MGATGLVQAASTQSTCGSPIVPELGTRGARAIIFQSTDLEKGGRKQSRLSRRLTLLLGSDQAPDQYQTQHPHGAEKSAALKFAGRLPK